MISKTNIIINSFSPNYRSITKQIKANYFPQRAFRLGVILNFPLFISWVTLGLASFTIRGMIYTSSKMD